MYHQKTKQKHALIIVLTAILICTTALTIIPQAKAATETYEFVRKWGSVGSGDGQFSNAYGVAVDSSGNVYVVDRTNNNVQKFSINGTFITKWGSSGSGDGQFSNAYGVAVDSSGNVYVVDSGNQRVQKFDSAGLFVAKWGSPGGGDGQFALPYGVAVDSSGNVYVVDTSRRCVQKFSSNGTFIAKWGSSGSDDGQFLEPVNVAVDSSGNVYVDDISRRCVQKFSSNGTFITKWGSSGSGDGLFNYPRGVAVDSSGNVYVVDSGNRRVQKFDSAGLFVAKWGSPGRGDGQFMYPVGIAVDSSGNVFVTDVNTDCVQEFRNTAATITFTTNGMSNDASDTVLTIDDTPYTYSQINAGLSFSSWAAGSTHTITAHSTVSADTGKQYVFSSWTNGNGLTAASGTFTTPSSDTTVTVQYQEQYQITPYYTVNGGGSPTVEDTIQFTSNGESATATPTLGSSGGTGFWADAGTAITYSSPIAGASGERWQIASGDTTTNTVLASVTSSQTVTAAYYHQYSVTFGYWVPDASTITSGVQIGTYTSFGGANNIDAGVTYGSASPASAWVDAGEDKLSYQTVTDGAQRWAIYGSPHTITIEESAEHIAYGYYHQRQFYINYAVVGGGSPTAPTLDITMYGYTGMFSPTLTTTLTEIWIDDNTAWRVTQTLDGSTATERWFTSQTVEGTVSPTSPTTAGGSLTFTYNHQFKVTFTASGGNLASDTSGTIVTVGGVAKTAADLPFTAWYDSGASVAWSYSYTVESSSDASGTQHAWFSTSGLGISRTGTLTISEAGTVTAAYKTQYKISYYVSGLAAGASGPALRITSSAGTTTYGVAGLPAINVWTDYNATITWYPTINGGSGKQYVFTGDDGGITYPQPDLTVSPPPTHYNMLSNHITLSTAEASQP